MLQRFHVAKELPMTVLRQRMTEDMQVRNLPPHTQASYLQQVSLFARHFGKSPDALTPVHIRTYQIFLMNEKKLAAGSVHIAVAALRFLYKITLKREWIFADVLLLSLSHRIRYATPLPESCSSFPPWSHFARGTPSCATSLPPGK